MTAPTPHDAVLERAERAPELFQRVTDFGNLYAAYKAAAAGKHDRLTILRHDLHAEKILWRLQWELVQGCYRHGRYRHFTVRDPKPRDVAAAPFTDRIVHHALVQQIEPLFERGFIYDSYACRLGKGTHRAALRLQHFLRSALGSGQPVYMLRGDIRKFFASVDHGVLAGLLARRIRDERVLALIDIILASYHEPRPAERRGGGSRYKDAAAVGIPIGNLTSQLFANVYLNELDQFIKHGLHEHYYLRYMDDFLILHHDKAHLWQVLAGIQQFCETELRLELHASKTGIHRFDGRERFVGYDLGPYLRRLSKPTLQRFTARYKRTCRGRGSAAAAGSLAQFKAYAAFAHTEGLIRSWEDRYG